MASSPTAFTQVDARPYKKEEMCPRSCSHKSAASQETCHELLLSHGVSHEKGSPGPETPGNRRKAARPALHKPLLPTPALLPGPAPPSLQLPTNPEADSLALAPGSLG